MSFTDNSLILCKIIRQAIEKGALRKAVLSKPTDKTLIKAVLSPINLSGESCAQLELFHKDNKATHKNFRLSESFEEELAPMLSQFSQINVLTSLGDCSNVFLPTNERDVFRKVLYGKLALAHFGYSVYFPVNKYLTKILCRRLIFRGYNRSVSHFTVRLYIFTQKL